MRYLFLFPFRLLLLLTASLLFFIALPIILYLDDDEWQRWLFRLYCGAFLMSWGSRIRYHGTKPCLNVPHVFVANHTSFIDYLVLSAHMFPHAIIAQKHGGIIGYFEDSVLSLNGSLMFNRNEKDDRSVLAKKCVAVFEKKLIFKRMRKHVHDPKRSPILIFPEGTCVNNEYTVLFHKGAFDLDSVVCPVAIKYVLQDSIFRYDKSFADAYWHTKVRCTFGRHARLKHLQNICSTS